MIARQISWTGHSWLQIIGGLVLGLLLGIAGSIASVIFYVGVLVCGVIWLLWRRTTRATRWFGFGLVLGFSLYCILYAVLIAWMLSQG